MNERIYLSPVTRQLVRDYDDLTRAVRTASDVFGLVEQGSRLLSEPGQIAVAETRFKEALQADPSDPRALIALANFYLVRENWGKAVENLERAVSSGGEYPDLWQVADAVSEKADPALAERIGALYARAPAGMATTNMRAALAHFSAKVRKALGEPEDKRANAVTSAFREAAAAAGEGEAAWAEFERRIPISSRPADERQELPAWIDWAVRAGGAAAHLAQRLRVRFATTCRDVPGVVTRFGHQDFGFLASDDGQDDIYFNREACEAYGSDHGDYISIGESAIFDLELPTEGPRWRAMRVRFPALESTFESESP